MAEEKPNTLDVTVDTRKQFHGEIPELVAAESIANTIGSGVSLASDRKVAFTHDLCCKHLELTEFIGERNLDDYHVSTLIGCMRDGTFHPEWVTLISAACAEDGKVYRINGQHTCWARLGMPKDDDCGEVRYQKYECQTVDDVRILYSSADRGKARNKAMVLHSYLHGTTDFGDLSRTTLRLLSQGMSVWLWEGWHDRQRRSGDQIAALMRGEHLMLCVRVGKLLTEIGGQPDGKMLLRAPSIGAILATSQKSDAASREFWLSVLHGVGFASKHDPRLKIRTLLMQSRLNRKVAGARVMGTEEMYRACIHAWNAWRRGEELSSIRTPTDSKRPSIK